MSSIIAVVAAAASLVVGLTAAMLRRRRAAPRTPAQRAAQTARVALTDPRVQDLSSVARSSLEQARERIDQMDTDALKQEVARRAAQAMDIAKAELPPLTRDATTMALNVADRLRAEGEARLPIAGERIRSDVAPAAKNWAQEAIAEAEEILEAARERAADLGETARRDLVPQLEERTGTAAGVLSGALAAGLQSLSHSLGDLMGRRRTPAAKRVSGRVAHRSGELAQQAGSQAKYVVGESTMIVVWAGAAGAVVYYGLLSPAKRERVRGFVTGAYSEVRELIRDLQSDVD